ncbi:MAG TPA: endopeptidase La, partial [Gemmatimonadetes bacterium]|nr:endopeptidase La [Gemmatimonadota bacterium]
MPTLIRADGPTEFPDQLPIVALRDLVLFPYMVLPLLIGRPRSTAALHEAEVSPDRLLLLLAQRDPEQDEAGEDDVFRIGTVARAVQVTPLPDGTCRVVLEGMGRATVERFLPSDEGVLRARVQPFAPETETGKATAELEAIGSGVARLFEEYAHLNERVPDDLP